MVDEVRIRARIHLFSAEDGGRAAPLTGGTSYRPNHNFFATDNRNMAMGFINIPEGGVEPGETFDTDLALFVWPELRSQIVPGRTWRIQEGLKLVGSGLVLDMIARE